MKKLLKLPLLVLVLSLVFCTCAVIVLADTQTVENVTLTTTAEGQDPVVETGLTYMSAIKKILSLKPDVATEYKIDCLTDVSMTEAAVIDGNTNKTVIVNLNGNDLTVAKTGIIPFQLTGSVKLVLNGGSSDSRANIVSRNPSGHFVYQKNLTGNETVSFTMSNVNLKYTNQSTYYCGDGGIWPNPSLFHIQVGSVTLTDSDVYFTGEDAKGGVGSLLSLENMSINLMQFSGNSELTATNVNFNGTNSKGIKTYAIHATGNAKVTLTNCKLNAGTAVMRNASTTGFVDMTNCEITASSTVFDGGGNILVKNCKVNSGEKQLTSQTSTSLKFFSGTSFDKKPSGTYSCENGYGIYRSDDTYNVVSNGGIYFSSLFSDGMVFQRNEPIHVFGYCDTDGVSVSATLGDQTKQTVSSEGKWEIVFDALPATKGLTLKVSAQGSEYPIVFEDIDIGEVWLLAGQSNMRHEVKYLEDSAEYYANANNYDNIRFYYQAKSWSWTEEKDTTNGYWGKADSSNIGNLSGIGYVMATKLAAEMEDITIAIVDTSYEGSSIQSWLPLETVKSISEAEYNKYLHHKEYYETHGSMEGNQRAYGLAETCHNRMVAPLAGYVVKGVIWYQGESNSGDPTTYRSYYNALTSFWRDTFNNDKLPFIVMQLAPNAGLSTDFRAAQYDIVNSDAYSYIISTAFDGPIFNYLDNLRSGNGNHVHPSRKSEIGLRTGDLILGEIYGTDTGFVYAAPNVTSVVFDGNTVTLTFDTDLQLLYGDSVTGFELGYNGSYVTASGTINGNVLTLTASGTEFDEVRYQYNKLVIERKDGTLMYVTSSYKDVDNYHATITDKDGNKYTFTSGTDEPIRSTLGGNLSNSSGYPLPCFSIKKSA